MRPTVTCPAQLRLLGDWTLITDPAPSGRGTAPIELPAEPQHLIAFLALHGPCPRTQVAGTLWPYLTDQVAAGRLRALLWRLRHRHPDLPPVLEVSDVSLRLGSDVVVDVDRFKAAAQLLIRGDDDVDCDAATTVLDSAELLPGWYDDWVLAARERLWHLRLSALDALATKRQSQRRRHEALQAALVATRIEPLHESAHRTIARIHLDDGNIVEAIQHYERFRSMLNRELGLSPSGHFTDLMRPYLQQLRRPLRAVPAR